MTLLKQCFCYSLRQGSFLIGTYSLIVYCLAFAVELWWIVEALLILPAPAYTLCALYFFNFVMAAILLFGLLIRQRKYLMGWSLMTVLSFFPECGMVLFMSLYYWPTHKYEYGVIELVYWSLRAIFNIFGCLCVVSLYLCWRDEELILSRLHDLTLASVESGSTGGGLILNGTLKRPRSTTHNVHNNNHFKNSSRILKNNSAKNFGYRNYGYLDSSGFPTDFHHKPIIKHQSNQPRVYRNHSFHHQQQQQQRRYHQPTTLVRHYHQTPSRSVSTAAINTNHQLLNSIIMNASKHNSLSNTNSQRAAARANLSSTTLKKNEFNPAIIFDPSYKQKSRISDLGIAGIGIVEPNGFPSVPSLHRTHSLWHVSNDDYWSRPPPSRPVSMGYVNHAYHNENNLQQQQPHTYYDSGGGESSNWNRRTTTVDSNTYYPHHTASNTFTNSNNNNNKNWLKVPNSNYKIMGRKATSMDGLHNLHLRQQQQQRYYGQNISNNFMMTSNQLANQNHWSKSSFEDEEEDEEEIFQNNYRDFAL